jgi:hypothetical protein
MRLQLLVDTRPSRWAVFTTSRPSLAHRRHVFGLAEYTVTT